MLTNQRQKIDREQYPAIKIGSVILSVMKVRSKDGIVTAMLAGLGGDRLVQRKLLPALHSFHRCTIKADSQKIHSVAWQTNPLISAQQDAEAWLSREEGRVTAFLSLALQSIPG